jgi:hypothetical protein
MNNTDRLGFWSALLTAISAVSFFVVGLFGSSYTEGIKYPYVLTTIRPFDYAVWVPAFVLAFAVVILVSCIHRRSSEEKKVFSQVALSFVIIYACLTISDFFIQWTVILPSILNNETAGLSLFSIYNPHGIPIAIESLGYLVLDLALLFVAVVIEGKSSLERAIRWLFTVGFVLAFGSFGVLISTGAPIVVFEVAAVMINVAILAATGILLGLRFKRAAA